MDVILRGVTQHAMNYAVRSGIAMTAGFAIKQCGRLLENTPKGEEKAKLANLQARLEERIRILAPAIEMIDLIAARGNTSLECAVSLTKQIREDVRALSRKLCKATEHDQAVLHQSKGEIRDVIESIQVLLARIEDAVPLINLAITTSGVNLSTSLSGAVSPSRLLQASTFLTAADSKYMLYPHEKQQVGPTYTLSLYMLFTSHATDPNRVGKTSAATWKEVLHKVHVKLFRTPPCLLDRPTRDTVASVPTDDNAFGTSWCSQYAYEIVLVEDLDDNRLHDDMDLGTVSSFEGVLRAGIRDIIPVGEISKILYADTGKLLHLNSESESNNPVLLLKRDVSSVSTSAKGGSEYAKHDNQKVPFADCSTSGAANDECENVSDDEQSAIDAQFHSELEAITVSPGAQRTGSSKGNGLPANLDPEWLAFEVYINDNLNDSDSDEDDEAGVASVPHVESNHASHQDKLSGKIAALTLHPSDISGERPDEDRLVVPNKVKTSLSLLEMTLKLASLQQFRQESHLAIDDELLNFFLEDCSNVGSSADKKQRHRVRRMAASRVGFDPYDQSPARRSDGRHTREK